MTFKKNVKTFENLYKNHFQYLCLVAFQITKNRAVSEDIVQDFFICLWSRKKETIFQISFKAYARKAVKNLSLQHVEKSKKTKLSEFNKASMQIAVEPEILLEKGGKNTTIIQLVDKIPESRRNIFISHVVEGLSYAQIAERYDISINTVKTQMKRSFAFLRSIENRDLTAMLLLILFSRF